MIRFVRNATVVCMILAVQTATAQQRTHHVDPRNMYERVLAVVPWTGAGSKADPKRAMFTPSPAQMSPTSRSGIIAFQCIHSDNGALALCEFVARDRSALNQILTAPGVKAFLKGRDNVQDAIAEFTKHNKNFDISNFGVRLP